MNTLICYILIGLFSLSSKQLYVENAKSSITIYGTSNLHDWTCKVNQVSGDLTGDIQVNKFVSILNAKIVCKTTSIDGEVGTGKSIMNDNIYDALNSEKFPDIVFTIKQITGIDNSKISGVGTLFIAGVSKPISFTSNYSFNSVNQVTLSGENKVKMTDFKIKPPTALLGTLKTGDDITIKYSICISYK